MSNIVILQGRLARPIAERSLPSGDRLTTIDLTVPAEPEAKPPSPKAEGVPLAWFDAPTWLTTLDVGEELVVIGRVRRRFFRTPAGLQSRTEVVVEAGAPTTRKARVADLLRRTRDALDALATSADPPTRR